MADLVKPHYCDWSQNSPFQKAYHDLEYGFPCFDEAKLFERLSLEIMQAGLSWETVLRKREAFRKAFCEFAPQKVAKFSERDFARLLGDASIIRNKLKIAAIIYNAGIILALREQGGFASWLEGQGEMSKEAWTKLFKKTFKFMGGEIVGEFLMSVGILSGAHREGCPILKEIAKLRRV